MTRGTGPRRRPAVQISPARAARLYRLVTVLGKRPRPRDELLAELGIGLRTYYRELELLRRCGVKVRLDARQYTLQGTAGEAEGRLPFPDPQLSFAEMAELATGAGPAARRLAGLLRDVVARAEATTAKSRRGRRPKGGGDAG
jgi:predicted DNA-binding transcriptional regulator YafY